MQEEVNENKTPAKEEVKIVKTDIDSKNGQNKCPKCGATDISFNDKTGHLRCEFCHHEFKPEKIKGMEEDLTKLEGQVLTSGSQNIASDAKDVITLKCSSCGAEVVIDTANTLQARCHWCRNTLSLNQQIPNGSVPDVVLPFAVKKDEARLEIEKFVGKRKFFAHPKFKQEFTTENIMGVFFPYMIVDANSHANLIGEGEVLTRTYTLDKETYYNADAYHVEREFDLVIEGLTIESNSDRLNKSSSEKTNNIINSIMPFDTENCIKWDANYLKGYTSEKRDVNVDQLKNIVDVQSKDIARYSANETLKEYDRGVCWSNEQFNIKGQQWKAAYLPVWLYSYQQIKWDKKLLHYVAVNARTKETMGSVPIHVPKLVFISSLVEILGFFAMLFVDWDESYLFLLSGFIYFLIMYLRYRNSGARHTYEKETKTKIDNLRKVDNFVKARKGLRNSRIEGANNLTVNGGGTNIIDSITGNKALNTLTNNSAVAGFIKDKIEKNKK